MSKRQLGFFDGVTMEQALALRAQRRKERARERVRKARVRVVSRAQKEHIRASVLKARVICMDDVTPEEAKTIRERRSKECCLCHQIKPITDFHLGGSTVDGHSSACRRCATERSNEYRRNFPTQEETFPQKWCPSCRQLLPEAEFWRSTQNFTGLQGNCKDCSRAFARGETVHDIRQRLRRPDGPRTRVIDSYADFVDYDPERTFTAPTTKEE